MISISTWVKKHPLICYFGLAYTLSWVIEIPLALQAQGIIRNIIFPFSFHYLAGYGPLLAALIVTRTTSGSDGLRELWGRMACWKVKPCWWLISVSPLGVFLLVAVALGLIRGQGINLTAMGQVEFLPPLGLVAIPMWFLTFGIGEETGWRGFALPRLQKHFNAFSATLILWVFWALWHLPLFFYSYDTSIIPGMLIGLLAGAITFTWLFNSTGGSILMVAIWHGLFNFTTACTSCKTSAIAAIISTLVMVWAVFVVIFFKPKNLSREEKQVV